MDNRKPEVDNPVHILAREHQERRTDLHHLFEAEFALLMAAAVEPGFVAIVVVQVESSFAFALGVVPTPDVVVESSFAFAVVRMVASPNQDVAVPFDIAEYDYYQH